ncbi:hypothetical protein EYF80_032793 [Liparis tanakae]|uniref:Uncharacterized protein n=1 Tax=Liparis tanakae TaxID=230148 RepID=A0A4Z2GW51_9TELE|nr:hypothetical protein EYF80_032793 [Liparis tanakae]
MSGLSSEESALFPNGPRKFLVSSTPQERYLTLQLLAPTAGPRLQVKLDLGLSTVDWSLLDLGLSWWTGLCWI